MALDERTVAEYQAAFERWSEDLRRLHEVLLEGKSLDPLHRVALLRRESHAKERYEAARERLFGLAGDADAAPAAEPAEGGFPFPPEE